MHDAQKVWNKTLGEYTYIMLAWVYKDKIDAERMGADAQFENQYQTNWSPNAGDFLYRMGQPANYRTDKSYPTWMEEQDSEHYGSHDIQFIEPYHWQPPHLPTDNWDDPSVYGDLFKNPINVPAGSTRTTGNLMIWDNGCYNPQVMNQGSRILEINPYVNAVSYEQQLVQTPWGPRMQNVLVRQEGSTFTDPGTLPLLSFHFTFFFSVAHCCPVKVFVMCINYL